MRLKLPPIRLGAQRNFLSHVGKGEACGGKATPPVPRNLWREIEFPCAAPALLLALAQALFDIVKPELCRPATVFGTAMGVAIHPRVGPEGGGASSVKKNRGMGIPNTYYILWKMGFFEARAAGNAWTI